jgi:hypothetical protein
MSSYTSVRIGRLTYGGSQQGRYDPQASLFNSPDLIRIGRPGEADFQHVYRISVGELRRRLELLGYTIDAIRCSVVEALRPLYASLSRYTSEIPYRAFLDFACGRTVQELVEVVRDWRVAEERRLSHLPTIAKVKETGVVNADDFSAALLDLLWGGSPFLVPSEYVYLRGHVFERLLCEVFDDETSYEFDMTEVIAAGYFEGDDDPVGNAFDMELGLRDPTTFVRGTTLTDEESETLEFKSVTSPNVGETIGKQVARYVIGFLNQSGGRVLFGVRDTGVVEGIAIRRDQRDDVHRRINAACAEITPAVPLREIGVHFRPVVGAAHVLEECFVVELTVPQGPAHEMFFRKDETWVRFGKETRLLSGHALFNHILSAYRSVRLLPPRASSLPPAPDLPAGADDAADRAPPN